MAITVRTNIAALRATTRLGQTQNGLTSSLERISSGLRINRSADDAAGQAVASKMESDNTSLKQAMRNTNDAISLVQTAEGGLNEIYNILVRLRELAVQASSSSYNSADRAQMDTEFDELTKEINRIADSSNFNRTNLLNSSGSAMSFQIGIHQNSDNVLSIQLSNFAATGVALGIGGLSVGAGGICSLAKATAAIATLDTAIDSLNTSRSTLGALQNRLENSLNEAASYSENLSSAVSQILDVDYASESANMTRYQIMQQAGVAALGQAKAIPQSVISLLS
jgi:flagellin